MRSERMRTSRCRGPAKTGAVERSVSFARAPRSAHELDSAHMRLVSLCPSLTELVFDLGRGPELVGVTEWCVHPADGVARIEKVGGTKDPRIARIVELAPDLVLMNEEENRREDAAALAAAGVRVSTTFPRDCAGTAEMVREIARALDRGARGEEIACEQARV